MTALHEESSQPNRLMAALGYAKRGWRVFPLQPNSKKPFGGTHGLHDGTTDEEQIRAWWTDKPYANIGIATGHGLVVIDEDTYKGADAAAWMLPVTLTAQTARDGRHWFYEYPGDLPSVPEGKLAPGICIKATGGYVVVEPSTFEGKPYSFFDHAQPLAQLPERIAKLIRGDTQEHRRQSSHSQPLHKDTARDSSGEHWIDKAVERAKANGRNNAGIWLAQQLLWNECDDPEGAMRYYARLVEDWDKPFYTEREALASLAQARKHGKREPAKARAQPAEDEPIDFRRSRASSSPPPNDGDHATEPPPDDPYVRPKIVAKGRQLHEVTTDVLDALHQTNEPPFIFQRSRALVRMVADENQRPVIDEMDEKALTCRMSDVADFIRMIKTGKDEESDPTFGEVAISPPSDLVKNVLAQPRWDFPALVGVTEAPFIRPDGTTCTTAGYDAATRLIYAPASTLRIPSIPDKPTKQQVAKALATLDDVISDFPFDSEASRAHALALLLVSVTRPAIRGLVPLALVTAPAAGTGKSLLTSIAVTVNTGRKAAMMVAADKEEEWTKRITATLMDGPAFVIIDNIRGVLKSPSLEGVLTTSVWKDRVLGVSRVIELPQRAVWLATGNNIQLGGDMPRRCYRIRLDAKTAHPERREGFKHPDIEAYVSRERSTILAALLTIARAWYADGCPVYPVTPMGTYEEWSRIIGCMLAHAGVTGFLSNLDEMYEEADSERPQWAAFFTAWHEQYGNFAKTAGEIAAYIASASNDATLRAALPDEFAPLADNAGALTKKLGYRLRELCDIRYDSTGDAEVFLERAGNNRTKTALWRVTEVTHG